MRITGTKDQLSGDNRDRATACGIINFEPLNYANLQT